MIIISCSHGKHLGHLIVKKIKNKFSRLIVDKFPDDELHLRFDNNMKNRKIFLVQSFYRNISDCVIEVIFAAKTAKELGAKKVILIAPYFPYLRQDKRFRKGEAVSQRIIADIIDKYFDEVYVIDPHLHRKNKLENIFKIKSKRLTANSLIVEYIKTHIKNPIIVGPDEESYKWAWNVANILGVKSLILKKKRLSSYNVKVKLDKKIYLKNKNVVIVDDIVSTGHTILETAKLLRKLGAKNIHCICVHGIFVNNALEKLMKAKIRVVSTNTIPSKVAKIDVSRLIGDSLK